MVTLRPIVIYISTIDLLLVIYTTVVIILDIYLLVVPETFGYPYDSRIIIDIFVGSFDITMIDIYICDSILVIFKTVVLAMDRFAGHIWDISNWSLFALLVIRFFFLLYF